MEPEDRDDLYPIWSKLDDRLVNFYEREIFKFLPTLDKVIRERIGWRRRYPEDKMERYQRFLDLVEEVYLTPSLYWKDNDSNRNSGDDSDGSE